MQEFIEFLGRNPILTVAWAGLFLALIVSQIKALTSKIKNIGHQEAVLLMNRENATVVDVRDETNFKKGHISGAVNVPLSEIKNKNIAKLEKLKSSPIIVVCNAGVTSSQAAQLLFTQGFETIYNLEGGMGQWTASNLPVARSKR